MVIKSINEVVYNLYIDNTVVIILNSAIIFELYIVFAAFIRWIENERRQAVDVLCRSTLKESVYSSGIIGSFTFIWLVGHGFEPDFGILLWSNTQG